MAYSSAKVIREKLSQASAWLCAPLLILSGCATVHLDAGFSEVGALVQERGGASIAWNSGSELDGQAAEKVSELLRGRLTADEAVQIALLNNRRVQAIYSDLGVAQADLVQAGLLKNPVFHGVAFFANGVRPEFETGVDLNFLEVLYVPLRKRVAAARFEETKLAVTVAILEVAGQLRTAFYSYQAKEQMLELRRQIVQALDASFEIGRRLSEAGNITDLDLARERARLEAGKLALRSAETAARQNREQLNILMGLWGNDTQWQTNHRLPDIPAESVSTEEFERLAVSRSLNLAQAKQRLLASGEQLGLDHSTHWLPELDFGIHGERREGPWASGPEISFPVPLFDQGQARIGRAAAELRRAQHEYYALAVEVRGAARASLDRSETARDRALYYRDIVLPLHERIVNEAQLQYNAMQLGPMQLLAARAQQIETAVAYIDALRDYWIARGELAQIVSGWLPGSNGTAANRTGAQAAARYTEGHN